MTGGNPPGRVIRVVLDTNILVSAALHPGSVPDRVLRLVREGYLTALTTQALLDEHESVLVRKFALSRQDAVAAAGLARLFSTMVEPRIAIDVVREDPPDNRVLECAVEGHADFIVTGDRHHLLPLKVFRGIRLVTPAQLLAEVTRS